MIPGGRPGTTQFDTPSDTEVRIRRVVDASRHLAFAAYTKPEYLQRWLLGPPGWEMPVCEIDARTGGSWRYVWKKTSGEEMGMGGKVVEVIPNAKIVTTESWGPDWPETINTVTFDESGGRTTITLTIAYPSKDARDAALKTGMKEGMEPSFARLDAVLKEIQ
jgi:uncharacterized protein YndB with AHSA1/START domain